MSGIKQQMNRRKQYCYDFSRPAVTVDVIVLRHEGPGIEVLLIKRKQDPFRGAWAFPGGFVAEGEPLEKAAARELEEETGLKRLRLDQLGAFGDPDRDPRGHTVTIAFTALLDRRRRVRPNDDAAGAEWFSIRGLPPLAFDHGKILWIALGARFGIVKKKELRKKKK